MSPSDSTTILKAYSVTRVYKLHNTLAWFYFQPDGLHSGYSLNDRDPDEGQGVSIRELVAEMALSVFNIRASLIHLQGPTVEGTVVCWSRKSYMGKKQFLIPVPQWEVIDGPTAGGPSGKGKLRSP